jgi:dihydrofolate reductase
MSNDAVSNEHLKRKPIWLIAAMDESRAIGFRNGIPWSIPGEQSRFREITMGNALIMGRMTYDSIGRPLAGRKIIVLTRQDVKIANVTVCNTVENALEVANQQTMNAICIGGGEEIYRAFLPLADRIYLTQVHANFGGDRLFPEFEDASFTLVNCELVSGPTPYSYLTFDRTYK